MDKHDLTQGNIWSKLLLYFLPLAIGTFFQQLYSAVDGFVVGKFVGTVALAAVGGSAYIISSVLVNFFVGLTGGGSVLIAQFCGANSHEALSKAVHTSMLFSVICGIAISVLGYIYTPEMLVWMETPAESMEDSVVYLRIIFIGAVFQLVFNMAAGILRAIGDSKSSFVYLAVSCSLNIVLDLIAVCIFDMGVAGAAYATILSQFICCFIAVRKLFVSKDEPYSLELKQLTINRRLLGRILSVGLPIALQSLMYSITNVMIQTSLNSLGTLPVAAWALTNKTDGFFWGLMNSASITISNFVGQNYGKRDFARIKQGIKASFAIFMAIAAVFSAMILSLGRVIFPLFTDDPELVDLAVKVVSYFAPYYVVWVVNEVFSGALRGEGRTLEAFIITGISICAFRVLWMIFLFPHYKTLFCLSIVYPVSWALCGIVMTIYYLYYVKHRTVVK